MPHSMNNFWIQCIIKALSYAGVFYDIITFPVYFLIQRPWARRNRSQRVKVSQLLLWKILLKIFQFFLCLLCFPPEQAKPISSDSTQITYRTADPPREMHLKMVQADIDTLEKVLKYIAETHKDKNCLGTRQVLSEEDEMQPNGRMFKKYKMGEYTWRSYVEVEKEACNFGYGIRKLGVQPKENVVIFSETRAEWMIAAHGLCK
jgi:long-chain acyl-CoA synthetase